MTDQLIQFEGGDILANLEERTITGLLLPYNEVGRTNVGRFEVEAGAVTVPTDPIVVSLNTDHDRHANVGRAIKLEDKPEGVFATFQFAKTPEGDAALADAVSPTGKRRKLSAEFGPAKIKAGKLVSGHAKLWGAAVVEAGAFPSAMVLAADTPEPVDPPAADEPTETTGTVTDEYTDEAGNTYKRTTTTTTRTEPDGEGGTKTTITEKTVLEEPDATAPADQEKEPPVAVPNTLAATPAVTTPRPVEPRQIYASIAALKANPDDRDAHQVLAALTDITFSGSNAIPATDVLRPNWLGPLYQGIPYQREYINLANLGTDITAGGKQGFQTRRGTSGSPLASPAAIPNAGTWAGNKAEINSYNGWTSTQKSFLRRFAVGNDIAREFFDLPGGEEVIEAFLKLVIEDHLWWSDTNALLDINVAAPAPTANATASYSAAYPVALGQVIQGILAVKAKKSDLRRDVPTFAIVNDEAYAQLVYAAGGEQNMPAFVQIAIATNSQGVADGVVQIVQGDTGISGAPSCIVGSKQAIEFDELSGGPLIVNALELAKGGIDRAVHGYLQTFTVRPEALVRIGAAPARANSTAYTLGRVIAAGAVIYIVTTAGTSGASAPTAPAVRATVADGTATLTRLF